MDGQYSTLDVRTRAVAALRRGMRTNDVAFAFGVDRTTVFRWKSRYLGQGEVGLQRKPGSGRPRKLEGLSERRLRAIVLSPASTYGFETDLWTVARLQAVLKKREKIVVSKDTIWRRLREAGLTYQKPIRVYREADEGTRNEWLKTVVPKIRKTVRKYKAILYFQDEANVSLTAFLGKTWAPSGQTPRAKVTGKRGGVAAMSAINGQGRLVFRLHDCRISTAQVIEFLVQMLKHHGRRHLVVVMDQARPHTSKQMQEFLASQPRLHVFYLPPYSPDWNPDEKVWNHLKHQELKSHTATSKPELKKLTQQKLSKMSRDPKLLRGIYFRCCVADLFG
jgi:transposase